MTPVPGGSAHLSVGADVGATVGMLELGCVEFVGANVGKAVGAVVGQALHAFGQASLKSGA